MLILVVLTFHLPSCLPSVWPQGPNTQASVLHSRPNRQVDRSKRYEGWRGEGRMCLLPNWVLETDQVHRCRPRSTCRPFLQKGNIACNIIHEQFRLKQACFDTCSLTVCLERRWMMFLGTWRQVSTPSGSRLWDWRGRTLRAKPQTPLAPGTRSISNTSV